MTINRKLLHLFGGALLLLGAVLANETSGWTATGTMTWNPVTTDINGNPDPNIAGYRVFMSTKDFLRSGVWISTVQAGADSAIQQFPVAAPTTSYLATFGTGATYYFRLTAYDTSGNQSGFNVNASNQDVELSTFVATSANQPSIAITAPANGATISGTTTIAGTAAPGCPLPPAPCTNTIVSVTVSIDGGPFYSATGTTSWTYSLNTTGFANGSHTITAKVTDSTSNTATASITVNVNNGGTGITVSINPLSTTTVSGTVTLTATATGGTGTLTVQFLLDGYNLGAGINAPPYSLTWNTLQTTQGTHTLTARACDIYGNCSTSAAVVVTVIQLADATPGLHNVLAYPNPAVNQNPTIRAMVGVVNSVEFTIFDIAGRVVNSATLTGAPTGAVNGEYYYDYTWSGSKASGIYFALIHAKAPDGSVIRARTKFAVVGGSGSTSAY